MGADGTAVPIGRVQGAAKRNYKWKMLFLCSKIFDYWETWKEIEYEIVTFFWKLVICVGQPLWLLIPGGKNLAALQDVVTMVSWLPNIYGFLRFCLEDVHSILLSWFTPQSIVCANVNHKNRGISHIITFVIFYFSRFWFIPFFVHSFNNYMLLRLHLFTLIGYMSEDIKICRYVSPFHRPRRPLGRVEV